MPVVLRVLVAFAVLLAPAQAQGQDPQLDPTTVEALENLSEKINAKVEARKGLAPTDVAAAAKLDGELRDLRWQFGSLAARLDVKDFEAPTEERSNLQAEIESLIEPLLQEIKSATETSREITGLRAQIDALEERLELAETAEATATRTRNLLTLDSAARAEADREIQERWEPTIRSLSDQIVVLEARMLAKEAARKSVLETVQDFLKKSGLNLFLCAIIFFAVLFTMRWVQNRVLTRQRQDRAVSLRVFEVLFSALGLLLAIGATMVVPYMRDDFLLLSIGIIFLIGAGWVLVKMAPQFFEQIRLILNIGSVREGERITIEGLPYRVDSLRFYSTLSNPDLQGGELRVPIQDLIGKRSRQPDPHEPWFPSKVGDIVLLGDDVIGPVTTQTPEMVVVEDYTAPRTYTSTAFMAAEPRNLSRGFGIVSTFGVDYRHQADATSKITKILAQALEHGLVALVPADQILHTHVQFESAGDSSLDYEARADFTGDAAPKYRELRRALQRILVEACNDNGWTIPFPQLTLHRVD